MKDAALLMKLQKEFSFYKNDESYFLDIIKTYKTYTECVKKIILDLKTDWENLNVDWFINFFGNSNENFLNNLEKIVLMLENYQIIIDIDKLEKILDKYPILNTMFKNIFKKKEKVSNEDIETITSNLNIISILIIYATLKNMYIEDTFDEEKEETGILDEYYSTDIVKQYLINIRSIPLLPKEEIIDIFGKIEDLSLRLNDNLSNEEKRKIEDKITYLKNKVIEANLRWVVKIAKRYVNSGVELMDLIQEGNNGLIKALDYYDYKRGYSFTTYATSWIFQAIQRYINNNGKTIRLPVHVNEKLNKIYKAKQSLMEKTGREPTNAEIAMELNVTEAYVNKMLSSPMVNVSLDVPIKNDERSKATMSNFIPSDENLEEEVFKGLLPEYINDILRKCLTKREEKIIRMRFGIPEPGKKDPLYEKEHTLQEVGNVLFVTRERVRQIEVKALRKLGNHKAKMQLQGYYCQNGETLVKKEGGVKNMFEEELKTKRDLYLEKIQLLSEEDRNYVFLRYGKDLTERNILDPKLANRAYLALKKVKRMIEDPNYVPRERKGGLKSKNGPVIKIVDGKRSAVYLKEKLKCSDDEITDLAFILMSDDEMDQLYNFYGPTLSNAINEIKLTDSDHNYLEKIYMILKEKLINLKRPSYLKNVLGVSEEDVIFLTTNLSRSSVRYKSLSKIYGSDLLQIENNLSSLTNHELNILLISLREIKKQIKNKAEIVTKDKKTKNIKRKRLLKDLLDVTDEEMAYLLNVINKNSKMYKALQKAFGDDLDKPGIQIYTELNAKERGSYYNALTWLRNKIKEYRSKKKEETLPDDNIQTSEEISEKQGEATLKDRLVMDEGSTKHQDDEGFVEIITIGKYEVVPTPLKHPFFKEFINLLPLKYKLMSSLRLGLYDGNIHSIGEIAEIFNVSEDVVLEDVNMGIDLFLTLVNRYQELYNSEFPNLDGELKLIKELAKK